jgi:pimeloyl-ACP methyl ester carboxylesterase
MLHYDERGEHDAPAIVLIMDLSLQMTAWPEALCDDLARHGFRVIRFDNRDIGLSTKLHGAPMPSATDFAALFLLQKRLPSSRVAPDLAQDTVGLLDALGLDSAHVVGLSMGCMVAQEMTLRAPHRVRSLVSMHSSTLAPGLPLPTPAARRVLIFDDLGHDLPSAHLGSFADIIAGTARRGEERRAR